MIQYKESNKPLKERRVNVIKVKENKKRIPKEKRLSRFTKGVIIYSAVLAVLLASLIGVLWSFLDTYEKNLPVKTAERFADQLGENELALLLEKSLPNISEFEDGALILSRSEFLSGEIKQAKLAKEYTSAVPVYRLICGENDIGKFNLKRSEKNAAFGIAQWEIDRVSLYPEAIKGGEKRLDILVCLPEGASLKANGKAVSTKHIKETGVQYSGKAVLASYSGNCDIYNLTGLCTIPTLEAEYKGAISTLTIENGKADWFCQSERSFVLTVPSDATLTIGEKTPSSALAWRGQLSEAVSEFEKHLGDALPETVSYLVSGENEENISVTVHGETLSGQWFDNDGEKKLIYMYSEESKYRVRAVLPEGAQLYINGVLVSSSYKKGAAPFTALKDISYLAQNKEKLSGALYEIGGLLCQPEISAKIGEKELHLCNYSKELQTFTAEFYGLDDEMLKASIGKAADAFTRAYFHYVANGAVGIEENYSALISLMKASSPGYKQIKNSKSSFEFVNQGVYRIDNITPSDFISLGSNIFYCNVDFSVNLRFYRNEKQYEGVITLIFVKEGESLLVCDMIIDSAS